MEISRLTARRARPPRPARRARPPRPPGRACPSRAATHRRRDEAIAACW